MVGPATVISPTCPSGRTSASSQRAMAASVIAMIRTSLGGTGRPTQVPAPFSVAARVDCSSRPSTTATGRHSVAP